jgi:hypothetical protein
MIDNLLDYMFSIFDDNSMFVELLIIDSLVDMGSLL